MTCTVVDAGFARLAEPANLQARHATVNEVLNKLQQMEDRCKKGEIDPKKNPAQLPKMDRGRHLAKSLERCGA